MSDRKLVSNYKEDSQLRLSFNSLAQVTFGINFEEWYSKGFWDDRYICYSLVEDGNIISNVSVTRMRVIVNGIEKDAAQIGTVMTHSGYRNQGLADSLMKTVLQEYENKVDFIYLFPNDSVMNFYPKYGFLKEHSYCHSTTIPFMDGSLADLHRVNIDDKSELDEFYQAVRKRRPISQEFDTIDCTSIYMWHCLNDLRDSIFRIKKSNSFVVYTQDSSGIEVHDVISDGPVDLKELFGNVNAGAPLTFTHKWAV